jgi:hypothetical protein
MKERKPTTRLTYHRDLAGFEVYETPLNLQDFLWDYIGRLQGTQVDTFILHTIYKLQPSKLKLEEYASETDSPVGFEGSHATWTDSKVMAANSWRNLENRQAFVDMNVDPVDALLQAAHKIGIDLFIGVRMNDVHHSQFNWHPKFWLEHPEFRIGEHPEYQFPRPGFTMPGGLFTSQPDSRVSAALDYMHQEVRDYKLALVEEQAKAYDVEGIELDFTRHSFYFKPTQVKAGIDKMTEFVATVRKGLNRIGEERGRPIVLSVRVPPSMSACLRVGLDVRKWITDKSVDVVTVTHVWHPDFGMPVEEFIDAAKGTNCKIIASIETAEMPVLKDSLATAKVIRAAASAYWQAGVDGMQMFNMHLPLHYFKQEPSYLNEIGDPKTLQYLDKHYMVTRASNFDHVAPFSYPKQLPVVLKENASGKGREIRLRVGDDLKTVKKGISAEAKLKLRVQNLTSGDKLEFKLNGVKLGPKYQATFFPNGESGGVHQYSFMAEAYYGLPGPYHWLEFTLEKDTLPRAGYNEVEVILRKHNPQITDDIILSDVELTIEYKKM